MPQQGYNPATETDFWPASNIYSQAENPVWSEIQCHILTNIPTASQHGLLQHERGLGNIQTLDNKMSPHCFTSVGIQGFQPCHHIFQPSDSKCTHCVNEVTNKTLNIQTVCLKPGVSWDICTGGLPDEADKKWMPPKHLQSQLPRGHDGEVYVGKRLNRVSLNFRDLFLSLKPLASLPYDLFVSWNWHIKDQKGLSDHLLPPSACHKPLNFMRGQL